MLNKANNNTAKHLALRTIISLCAILCSATLAHAQTDTSASPTIRNSFIRKSGDTVIYNASPMLWGSTMSSYWGYSPINATRFNAVMEKNGHAPVGDWVYTVGLGRSYMWDNFHVSVYGNVGFTLNNPSSANTNKRASLFSFGIDEYLGYVVFQNETFRLFPQVGLHLNTRSYTSSDRNASIDAGALQLANPPQNTASLTLTGFDIATSIGIGGDVRIPFPQLYKTEGSDAVYRQDLLLGFQVGLVTNPLSGLAGDSGSWSTNGARISNLPSLSEQGLLVRLTFTTDLHQVK